MTRDNYRKLLTNSRAFQGLDPEYQKMILEAPADRMLDYTQIFLDEQNQMAEAKKNFIQDSMEVIQKFKNDLQSIDVKKRRELEKKVKAQEEAEEEAMLAQMNNL